MLSSVEYVEKLLNNLKNSKGGEKIRASFRILDSIGSPIKPEEGESFLNKYGEYLETGLKGVNIKLSIKNRKEKVYIKSEFINENGEKLELNKYDFISEELYSLLISPLVGNIRIKPSKIYSTYYKYRFDISKGEKFHLKDGKIYAGKNPIKPGKFTRELGFSDEQMYAFTDGLLTGKLLKSFDNLKIGNVEEIYNSPKLKIGSCMTGEGFDLSVLEEAGAKVIYLEDMNKNILARVLVWEERFFDRIYASSPLMAGEFRKALINNGYSELDEELDFSSNWIEGNPKERFIPYMDTIDYIEVEDGRFRFGTKVTNLIASSTGGRYNIR